MKETFHNPDIMSEEEERAWDELEARLARNEARKAKEKSGAVGLNRPRTKKVLAGAGATEK